MLNIKKILFPVDFSQRAKNAVPFVESIAERFEAEIMLLHVIDSPIYDTLPEHPEASGECIESFLAGDLATFSVRRVSAIGNPSEEIIKMVQSWTPDLIMLPSYALGFFRPDLLGSVTAKVLQNVSCPLWTGVYYDDPPPPEPIAYRKILCALDFGDRDHCVLEWARSFSDEYQAELKLVHATSLTDAVQVSAEARVRMAALVGSNSSVLATDGDPGKAVASAAREFGADLVVLGKHRADTDEEYLHHNAYSIIRNSPCPAVSI